MPIYAAALPSLSSSYSSVANNLRGFLRSQASSSPAASAFVGSDVEAVCLRHFYQVRGTDRARGDGDAERRNIRSDRSSRLSKIKAARSNRSKSKVVWLYRKRILVHCSIPIRDRGDKLVILHD